MCYQDEVQWRALVDTWILGGEYLDQLYDYSALKDGSDPRS